MSRRERARDREIRELLIEKKRDSLASFTGSPVLRCATRSLLGAARPKDSASREALQPSPNPCLFAGLRCLHTQHQHRQEQGAGRRIPLCLFSHDSSRGQQWEYVAHSTSVQPPLPPSLDPHISRPTPPPPSPDRPACLLSLSQPHGQRCVLGASHRRRHRAVCHAAAAQVLTISGDVDGGNDGEAGCEGIAGSRRRDDALPIHARPGQGEHGLPGAACGGCKAFYYCCNGPLRFDCRLFLLGSCIAVCKGSDSQQPA